MGNIRWFTDTVEVEAEARAQVEQTASMPFVRGVAVMPDVHYGKGSTVGTVIATKGAIMPACVGVDIGCGMIAVRTSFDPKIVREKAQAIREGIERRIPLGIGLRGMNSKISPSALCHILDLEEVSIRNWSDRNYMNARAKDWHLQLGSLGGGNHFIEVCIGHAIMGEGLTHWYGPDEVWVILHSGSRGVGNKTGTYWTNVAKKIARDNMYDVYLPNPDLAYLVERSEGYWEYMKELYWCQMFAQLNREEMMTRVMMELGRTVGDVGTYGSDALPVDFELERINCHHNYVTREHHDGENVTITRKGAVLASDGKRSLIPGSMGAASYICTGKGHPGAYHSAPHGAGRRMSRGAARKQFTLEQVSQEMADRGVEARIRDAIIDEAPGAYKDIDAVMFDARELVTPTHRLRQIISVKGD